ncbi:cytochrome P450 [Chroococcus sp. FPU101]|uniref:cytochrome P450 n=1 Tax=Chroococcus sp. FPU101 TaxID=1974212 RepID=UPI001A8DBEBD|nr:cytochrome P450 [Chroococcus sp. FPU101]GFE69085.1 cytochrome P450 [Chroococcus sp. FPU101]
MSNSSILTHYLPDGPKSPLLLQRFQILTSPLETLDHWSKSYGDIFRLGGKDNPPIICISNPNAIKSVLTASSEVISSEQTSDLIKPLIGTNSILFLNDKNHQRVKRIMLPAFAQEQLKNYQDFMIKITQDCLNQYDNKQIFLVRSLTHQITLQIILKLIFGVEAEKHRELQELLLQLVHLFDNPLFSICLAFPFFQTHWGIWGDYQFLRQQIDQFIYREISERRAKKEFRQDILSLLLLAQDQETGQSLDIKEIRDNLMTLIFAGYETTSAALSWSLYWTHYLPSIRQKLLMELDSNQGSNKNISQLTYLNAVCQETLRLYPIAISTFSRTIKQPFRLESFQLEPGTIINISIYLAHHRTSAYPEPKQFNPERFLERQFSPFEYLPFGGGERHCLGATFALQEMKCILATIISSLNLEIINPEKLSPVRHGIAMIPPKSLSMKVI